VCGKNNTNIHKQGFTLIELMIVIAIIGMIAAVAIPNFRGRTPTYERNAALAKLNGLARFAWQNALTENKMHRVAFKLPGDVSLLIATGDYKLDEPVFMPLERDYAHTTLKWPEQLEIKQFLIDQKDAMREIAGAKGTIWFVVMPDGLAQNVIINFIDTKDVLPDGTPKKFGLVLNPFSSQFKLYDSFQK